MKYYIKDTCAFKWARKLPRKTETYESAKCVPCNTRKSGADPGFFQGHAQFSKCPFRGNCEMT